MSHARGFAKRSAVITLLAGTMLTTGTAFAQGTPDASVTADDTNEIVVTATKREESLQKVPISIQALTATKLEQHQVANIDDYAKLLPSVSYQSFGPGQSQIYFRGVTSGSDANGSHSGSQPTSALYVDEIPLTTIGGAVDLHVYDIQRVEALSGPQGTLFGSSSLSGTLRIITNKPDTSGFYGSVDASGTTFGKGANSHGGSFDAMLNIPLSSMMALRVSGFYKRDGGYISNVPGTRTYHVYNSGGTLVDFPVSNAPYVKKNFNDVETYGGRAALGINLDDNWTVTPSVIYQSQKSHGTFLYGPVGPGGVADPPNTRTPFTMIPGTGDLQVQDYTPEYGKDDWFQAAMTIHGKLGEWDVTYAGGYFERHVDTIQDYSAYNVNYQNVYAYFDEPGHIFNPGLSEQFAPNYNSVIDSDGNNLDPSQIYHGHDNYTKQSHELRVSSPGTDRFRLTAGLFYQRQTDQINADYLQNGLATSQGFTEACGDDVFCTRVYRVDRDYAAFGDVSFDILPNLTLNGGIRGFITNNTLSGFSGGSSAVPFYKKASEQGETHKVNLSWKVDRDHLIYATYSTGYRPGGINRLEGVFPYKADTLTNYEIGVKTAWFGRKLIVNAAIFDEEWHDVQYAVTVPGTTGTLAIFNVGKAKIKGVEGDFSAMLGHLNLSGSATYIDAKATTDFCGLGASGNPDCTVGLFVTSGSRLPIQPQFKGTVTARYSLDIGSAKAFVQASANHQSSVRSALGDSDALAFGPIAGFTTADFSLGADMGGWHWEAFLQNAFDKRGTLSLNSACIPSACAQYGRAYPVKPQMFGLKAGMKF